MHSLRDGYSGAAGSGDWRGECDINSVSLKVGVGDGKTGYCL